MAFSKIRMGQHEIFETTVKDVDGRILNKWVVVKKDYPKVMRILNEKFGLGVIIKDKKKKSDLDWAMS